MSRKGYELIYDTKVKLQLSFIARKFHSIIRKSIENNLIHEPEHETQNKKRLVNSSFFESGWEIRCGAKNEFRIFYRINHAQREVYILAIGVKRKNVTTRISKNSARVLVGSGFAWPTKRSKRSCSVRPDGDSQGESRISP